MCLVLTGVAFGGLTTWEPGSWATDINQEGPPSALSSRGQSSSMMSLVKDGTLQLPR